MKKLKFIFVYMLVLLPSILLFAWCWGFFLDYEYIHWRKLWIVSRLKAPSGSTYTKLIAEKEGIPESNVDWHYCGWCKTTLGFVNGTPIKAIISKEKAYLFSWDKKQKTLTPATVKTAIAFPKLVPDDKERDYVDGGLDGHFNNDTGFRFIEKETP